MPSLFQSLIELVGLPALAHVPAIVQLAVCVPVLLFLVICTFKIFFVIASWIGGRF